MGRAHADRGATSAIRLDGPYDRAVETKKSRSGTHEQFAKTCRRGLLALGWFSVFVGALSILLSAIVWLLAVCASARNNELVPELFSTPLHVFVGLSYLAFGAVAGR